MGVKDKYMNVSEIAFMTTEAECLGGYQQKSYHGSLFNECDRILIAGPWIVRPRCSGVGAAESKFPGGHTAALG